MKVKNTIIKALWEMYKELESENYHHEKSIYYSNMVKDGLMRFIDAFDKEEYPIDDLVKMFYLMSKVWLQKMENDDENIFIMKIGMYNWGEKIYYVYDPNSLRRDSEPYIRKVAEECGVKMGDVYKWTIEEFMERAYKIEEFDDPLDEMEEVDGQDYLWFEYHIPDVLFSRVEKWFGEQTELDEIMGRV